MMDTNTTDPQEQMKRLQGAWSIAMNRLESCAKLVERLGMRVEDFDMEEKNTGKNIEGKDIEGKEEEEDQQRDP